MHCTHELVCSPVFPTRLEGGNAGMAVYQGLGTEVIVNSQCSLLLEGRGQRGHQRSSINVGLVTLRFATRSSSR